MMKNEWNKIDKIFFSCVLTLAILVILLLIPVVIQVWAKVFA
jgi:hypothetical protein